MAQYVDGFVIPLKKKDVLDSPWGLPFSTSSSRRTPR